LRTPAGSAIEANDIYRLYFHGPAYQVIERAWWNGQQVVALLTKDLPANHHPAELGTLISPRLVELCFQAAGVWEIGVLGRMGLPQHIDQLCPMGQARPPEGRVYARITPDPKQGSFDADVVDETGNVCFQLRGYRTAAVPNPIAAEPLKVLQALMSAQAVVAA
jgi:hypothetical protein